ncbi:class I SAM-dependent methyltransferase [Candidatus Woesearchaeota archaeon]|nr:class I SAM-dependent methyltransferase [Candidatus Woesearchaeota archaeon]MCF8013576.1 class I SAM-dependent methyltransferase [Candidatus Woesearchaeota archaeon]
MAREITKKELNKLVDNYENTWNSLFYNRDFVLRINPDPHIQNIIQDLEKNGITEIASAPCGDYVNEQLLEEKGINVEGYDISEIGIEKAAKRTKTPITKHDILKKKLPKTYPAILCFDFTVHLPDEHVIKFLENMKKSLKKNGRIYINFLNPEDETTMMHELDKNNITLVKNNEVILKYRKKQEIEALVKEAGLEIISMINYERTDKGHKGFRSKVVPHTHKGYCAILTKE